MVSFILYTIAFILNTKLKFCGLSANEGCSFESFVKSIKVVMALVNAIR